MGSQDRSRPHRGHSRDGMLSDGMPIRRKTLLLDLDGTLVDPAPGIIGSCRHALQEMGAPVPAAAALRWVSAPPLRASFAKLLAGRGEPEQALELYRAQYVACGLYEAKPYPDIHEVLARRVRDGTKLILCTAKPEAFARRVVDY